MMSKASLAPKQLDFLFSSGKGSPHSYLPSAPSQEGSGRPVQVKASFFLWTGQLNASHKHKGEC